VPVCQEGRLIRQLLHKLMTPLAMRLNSQAEVGGIEAEVHIWVCACFYACGSFTCQVWAAPPPKK
jgi:hypothetical protein